MVVSKVEKSIRSLMIFRKNMGMNLPKEKVERFWGKVLVQEDSGYVDNSVVEKKVEILKKNLERLLIFNWVQFIGVTGSVASGNVKSDDDIDVIIVVKNNRMWLYRGFLVLKLGCNSIRRVWGKSSVNKIDTNLICEERGILFDYKNIFVLHELLFIIPVYKKKYHEHMLGVNYELLREYGIKIKKEKVKSNRYLQYIFPNFLAFILQYIYMVVMRHRPDLQRLLRNNRAGRIEFFPKNFSSEKIREFQGLLKAEKTF